MSRDYKTSPGSPVFGKNGNMLLVGVFVGYALGLLTAIGTWMYINQAPSPFISQEKSSGINEMKSPVNGNGGQVRGEDRSATTSRPRFEFYKILPDTEELVAEQSSGQAQAAQQPLPQQPASQQMSPMERYYLQAGSFQNAEDAENLKAKLAMLGIEASVQAADVPEKGIWHRVRLGPYATTGDMDRIRASLQQSGIQSSPVKVGPGAL